MSQAPEPCLSGSCRSPVACGGWGYCLERNKDDRGAPTPQQIDERRRIAAKRAKE